MTRIFLAANRAKNNRDSECGKVYAFLTVGPKPRTSTIVKMTTAHNGSEVTYHNGNEEIAVTKNNPSIFVTVISARLMKARNAIYIVIIPETPIGQAPTPPLPSSWARKTMKVLMPQMTQEKTWGFVVPLIMLRI